jgi:hypothetical protein
MPAVYLADRPADTISDVQTQPMLRWHFVYAATGAGTDLVMPNLQQPGSVRESSGR